MQAIVKDPERFKLLPLVGHIQGRLMPPSDSCQSVSLLEALYVCLGHTANYVSEIGGLLKQTTSYQ